MNIKSEGKELYKETFRILRKALNNNQLVLFVGAGASKNSGMPLWGEAISEIADKLSLSVANEDTLKIPQYYFNARGKKEYTELMRKIFKYDEELKITKLHKKIIELQTYTIITTNYDHLIEKAAKESGQVIQVISQDKDMPYRTSARELIKMHGDFEHDNFVLKEDDYLHYSSNFKLIETYIKSLIGSKVILFIGYSLNDPNVKQIISWVKEVIGQDFQRAYIILPGETPDTIKRDYFKNLGVNIIYPLEFINIENNKEKDDFSIQILETLNLITDDTKVLGLNALYQKLYPLKDLNYVYGKYISRAFYEYNIYCDGPLIDLFVNTPNIIFKEINQLLWNHFQGKEIPTEHKNKLQFIENILKNSRFKIIRDKRNISKYLSINNIAENEIETMIFNFDYVGLHNLMEQNQRKLSYETPELYMQQAYICSFLGNYELAYNYLKTAASIFYKSNSYVWYFIAVFNQKYVGKLFENPLIARFGNASQNIIDEAKNINLERILNSLPHQNNDEYSFLKELSSFNVVYTLFYDVFKKSVKAVEEAKTNYTLYAGTAAYQELRLSIQDYNSYIIRNYIILDRYIESSSIFVLYIRSIISSVNAKNIPPDPNDQISVGNVKLEKIGAFEIYAILKYMNKTDIKKLFDEYEIKTIPVDETGLNYLESIFDSLCTYSKYVNPYLRNEDKIWEYLELASHVEIKTELAVKIIYDLCTRDIWDININSKIIERFLINIYNQNQYEDEVLCQNITKLIGIIIDYFLRNKDHSIFNCSSLLNVLMLFNNKGNNSYSDSDKIQRITANENISLIIDLFSKLDKRAQQPIIEFFSKWKPNKNALDYYRYCSAVLNDIIPNNEDIEKEIFDWILFNMSSKDDNNDIFVKRYDYNDVLGELMNLYLSKKIINIETLKIIIEKETDNMWKWLFDIDSFDYSNFDCSWLENCSPNLLETISYHTTAVKGILNAYKTQYKTKALKSCINDYVVEYFLTGDEEESKEPAVNL